MRGIAINSFLLVFYLTSCLRADDPAVSMGMSNGNAWNGMLTPIKLVYVSGLADGILIAQREITVSPAITNEAKAAETVRSILPPGRSIDHMILALNEFYKDPANLLVPIPIASRIARDKMEAQETPTLQEKPTRIRKFVIGPETIDSVE